MVEMDRKSNYMNKKNNGARIHIGGIVQGVGFRPHVYNLATSLNLKGWVRNSSSGVDIQVTGKPITLENFISRLKDQPPPLAKIDQFQVDWGNSQYYDTFEIIPSLEQSEEFIPISPDVCICNDCLSELFDPQDHRYRYPFINCTNCGPRFTIIQDIPYDRANTTMSSFTMCEYCENEYRDPSNRRFHAQPVACPDCGPHIWLEKNKEVIARGDDSLAAARQMLKNGKILAVKGLGGFHLACDAKNQQAVSTLRSRKQRIDKPFALMAADLDVVKKYCQLSSQEQELLTHRERAIVILDKLLNSQIAEDVAPGQSTLGVMLPYTPLHYLLLEPEPGYQDIFVMTSGNYCEEPLSIDNEEAREKLDKLADAFLFNNRDIHIRCDDSVIRSTVRTGRSATYPLRRSRGYAPNPILLPWEMPQILATGGELKNTFCLTKDHYAFISHHIGDLENFETLSAYEEGISHYKGLFRCQPQVIAYDMHPNYMSTRYALERDEKDNLVTFPIQHHHAHIAACMADNNHPSDSPVIGVSFDGTGYGTDGTIWGGEILIADYKDFQRVSYLSPFPLPGGDTAIKQPWRIALALLWTAGLEWDAWLPCVKDLDPESMKTMQNQLIKKIYSPLTSSMGRLFDGVAAITGVRQEVNYEAQAAIEFEALADQDEQDHYEFDYQSPMIGFNQLIEAVVADMRSSIPISKISARFHRGIAEMINIVCVQQKKETGINDVALSGGVWQNMYLLELTLNKLERSGFNVIIHQSVPTNDGGLSLGQAVIAYHNSI